MTSTKPWIVVVSYEGGSSTRTEEFETLREAIRSLVAWEPLEGKLPLAGAEGAITEGLAEYGAFFRRVPDVDYLDDSAYLAPRAVQERQMIVDERRIGWDDHGHAIMTGIPEIDSLLGLGNLQDAQDCGYDPQSILAKIDVDEKRGAPLDQFRSGRIHLRSGAILQFRGWWVWACVTLGRELAEEACPLPSFCEGIETHGEWNWVHCPDCVTARNARARWINAMAPVVPQSIVLPS